MTIEQDARAYAERHAVATENVETAVQRVMAAYIAGASRSASPATSTRGRCTMVDAADPHADCRCGHGRHVHVRYVGACGLCDCPAVRGKEDDRRHDAADQVCRAWLEPGPEPAHHLRMQHFLRSAWPTLGDALDALAREKRQR